MNSGSVLEAEFEISCSQCGGQKFQEIFPVPAETYQLYGPESERGDPRNLIASVYACLQCGHLEKFVNFAADELSSEDTST